MQSFLFWAPRQDLKSLDFSTMFIYVLPGIVPAPSLFYSPSEWIACQDSVIKNYAGQFLPLKLAQVSSYLTPKKLTSINFPINVVALIGSKKHMNRLSRVISFPPSNPALFYYFTKIRLGWKKLDHIFSCTALLWQWLAHFNQACTQYLSITHSVTLLRQFMWPIKEEEKLCLLCLST